MDKIELGKKIREARTKAGLTQEALAERAEIGSVYLGEIERGTKTPSLKLFVKLINVLDISADYVLRDEVYAGKSYVLNEITESLSSLTPPQRKTAADILSAYISNVKK